VLSVPGSMAGAVWGHVLTSASGTYRSICAAGASDQPRDPRTQIDGSTFASARGTSLPNFLTVGNRTNEVGEEVVSFQVRVCSLVGLGRLFGRGESALTPKGRGVVEVSCTRGEQLQNEHLLQRCAEHQQGGRSINTGHSSSLSVAGTNPAAKSLSHPAARSWRFATSATATRNGFSRRLTLSTSAVVSRSPCQASRDPPMTMTTCRGPVVGSTLATSSSTRRMSSVVSGSSGTDCGTIPPQAAGIDEEAALEQLRGCRSSNGGLHPGCSGAQPLLGEHRPVSSPRWPQEAGVISELLRDSSEQGIHHQRPGLRRPSSDRCLDLLGVENELADEGAKPGPVRAVSCVRDVPGVRKIGERRSLSLVLWPNADVQILSGGIEDSAEHSDSGINASGLDPGDGGSRDVCPLGQTACRKTGSLPSMPDEIGGFLHRCMHMCNRKQRKRQGKVAQ
jgi:hypothetical protein